MESSTTVSLVDVLASEYPDVPGPTVAQLVELAYAAVFALGGGSEDSTRHVGLLARDRLDAARARTASAQRPPARAKPGEGAGAQATMLDTRRRS